MRLMVLSGPIGVGKTSFGNALIDLFGATRVSTRHWLLARTGCQNERSALQVAGDRLDAETAGAWVADAVEDAGRAEECSLLLLDSARIEGQVKALRGRFPDAVFHVHLSAEPAELERRYFERESELEDYAGARNHATEAQVGALAANADLVLDTDHSGPESLASTAMAIAGRTIAEPKRLVDVIIGGQYGSEGKGNICANIARKYGGLIRIGGPNAVMALDIADDAYVMESGRVVLAGRGKDLLDDEKVQRAYLG